jgi:hypothetical protein
VLDYLSDGHLGRRTCQPLGKRQGDVFGALGPGAEDDGLGFGEFGHGGFLYSSLAARKAAMRAIRSL